MVSPSVHELRYPARHWLWPVGEKRDYLPNVRGVKQPRHCSSSGRLGPGGRARMALLASPDVGIRRRTLLKNRSPRSDRSAWQRKSPAAAAADPSATSSSTSQCSSTAVIATTVSD